MEIKQGHTLQQFIKIVNHNKEQFQSDPFDLVVRYTNVYEKPLSKSMFVPCDDEGNEIEEPPHVFSDHYNKEESKMYQRCPGVLRYKEAEKKVIFKGFSFGMDFISDSSCRQKESLFYNNLPLIFVENMHEWTIGDLIQECHEEGIVIETQNINI